MGDQRTMAEIIAKALSDAESERIRELMSEAIAEQMERWDVKDIITKALTPFVKEIVADLMKQPDFQETMAARIRQQTLVAAGKIDVRFSSY